MHFKGNRKSEQQTFSYSVSRAAYFTRMPPLLFWIFSFSLLTHGGAQAISCVITQEAERTCYSITQFSGTECYYSWTNETGHVVANHEAQTDDLVVAQNISALTTNKCLNEIYYIRDCISEAIRHEVTCSTNCSGTPEPFHNKGGFHIYYCIIVAAVLMVVGLIIYIVRKRHCYRPVNCDEEAP